MEPDDEPTETGSANRRRFLNALGVIGVTGLAGCGGDGDGDTTDTPTNTPTSDSGGDDGNGGTENGNGNGDNGGEQRTPADLNASLSPGEYQFGDFGGPITLEYETFANGSDGSLVVDVSDVTGDSATYDIQYIRGDTEETATLSGDFGELYRGTYTGAADQVFALLFVNRSVNYHNKQLDVGAEWNTRTGIPGENKVTVTGTDTHAGVECYTAELTIDDELVFEICLRPGFGTPIRSVVYDQDATMQSEGTLVRAERP